VRHCLGSLPGGRWLWCLELVDKSSEFVDDVHGGSFVGLDDVGCHLCLFLRFPHVGTRVPTICEVVSPAVFGIEKEHDECSQDENGERGASRLSNVSTTWLGTRHSSKDGTPTRWDPLSSVWAVELRGLLRWDPYFVSP